MGEIGRTHEEFMHSLCSWQIRSIIRGYYRRNRDLWSATRWQTFNLMCCSMADLKSAGIYKPTDLITFPWEEEQTADGTPMADLPDLKEQERLRRIMREENALAEAEAKRKKAENKEPTQ